VPEALSWIERSIAWAEAHGLLVELALSDLAYAEVLTVMDRPSEAVSRARQALRVAKEHGLGGIASRAERWMTAADSGVDAQLVSVKRLVLTPREEEILRLVAQGRTNQQIAVVLQISTHTANRHLSNILGKLSVSNRAEA